MAKKQAYTQISSLHEGKHPRLGKALGGRVPPEQCTLWCAFDPFGVIFEAGPARRRETEG